MKDLGLLTLRLVVGGLMAGHGAQKLFGSFGGPGPKGTAGWLASMGFRPSEWWAWLAGGSEFGSGVLTALGLASPLGPIGMLAPMAIATGKAHWGKPIWVTAGGAELPVTNIAAAAALALAGPGRFSLDRALGLRLPAVLVVGALAATVAGIGYGLGLKPAAQPTGGGRTDETPLSPDAAETAADVPAILAGAERAAD